MSDYPVSHYSKKQVVKAGKALRAEIPYDPSKHDDYVRIFRVAHDWRSSHAYPMRAIRADLIGKLRKHKVEGITAARIKRMVSIRKKLARQTTTLLQMQDLGGCRAIVPSIREVNDLIGIYRGLNDFHRRREDTSYIDNPQPEGYRGHHFVFEFEGDGEDAAYNGRRIEMQLRSRLQHAWATAVEAVGLVRNEDLKAAEGNPDWLRLFALMASDFAEIEGAAVVPGTPPKEEREREIRDINAKLKAANMLENLRQGLRATDQWITRNSRYFLIQYDNVNCTVHVEGFNSPIGGADSYSKQEVSLPRSGVTTVLVEVDKIEDLKEAYPNYFLDVRLFTEHLQRITTGKVGQEFAQANEAPKPLDLSWLKDFRR